MDEPYDDATMRIHSHELAEMLMIAAKSLSREDSISRDFSRDFSREDDNWVDVENNPALANSRRSKISKKPVLVGRIATGQEILTERLLEGYILEGGVCDRCIMPKMSYKGKISCVVCSETLSARKSSAPKGKRTLSPRLEHAMSETDDAFSIMLRAGNEKEKTEEEEEARDDKESRVDREVSEYNERRTKATDVYATLILEGYTINDSMCEKCDMPLMEYQKVLRCVFCKEEKKGGSKENEEEVSDMKEAHTDTTEEELVNANKESTENNDNHGINDEPIDSPLETEVKVQSRAEKLAERLRSIKAQGNSKGVEQELDQAEQEIMQMIKCLEMHENQIKGIDETRQDFNLREDKASSAMSAFTQKIAKKEKQWKDIEEASQNVILEAEVVAKNEGHIECEVEEEEDWDTRVFEGRALMNRRRLQGWKILKDVCAGEHCNATPLMQSPDGIVECVVCRGSGNGNDGVYGHASQEDIDANGRSHVNIPRAVMVDGNFDDTEEGSVMATVVAHDSEVIHDAQCVEKVSGTATAIDDTTFTRKGNTLSCNVGETVFPSLRNLIAGVSNQVSKVTARGKETKQHLQAKKKIAHLVEMGWEVSAEHCETCDMPLFSTVKGADVHHLCVLCGPIVPKSHKSRLNNTISLSRPWSEMNGNFKDQASNEMARLMLKGWKVSSSNSTCDKCLLPLISSPESGEELCVGCSLKQKQKLHKPVPTVPSADDADAEDILEIDIEKREQISRKMVNHVMSGWSIVEGKQCQSCFMPIMLNPETHKSHCIACEPEFDSETMFRPVNTQPVNSPYVGANTPGSNNNWGSRGQGYGGGTRFMAGNPCTGLVRAGYNFGGPSDEVAIRAELNKHFLLGWTLSEYKCPACHNQLLVESFQGRHKCLYCGPQSYRTLANFFPVKPQFMGNVAGMTPSSMNAMHHGMTPSSMNAMHHGMTPSDMNAMHHGMGGAFVFTDPHYNASMNPRDPTPTNMRSRVLFDNDPPGPTATNIESKVPLGKDPPVPTPTKNTGPVSFGNDPTGPIHTNNIGAKVTFSNDPPYNLNANNAEAKVTFSRDPPGTMTGLVGTPKGGHVRRFSN